MLGHVAPQLQGHGDRLEKGSGAAQRKAAAVRALRSCLSPEPGMCQAQGLSHLIAPTRAEGMEEEAAMQGERAETPRADGSNGTELNFLLEEL